MSDFISELNILNANKDKIIREVRAISTQGVTKTQAQNLRENAARTESIDEILLYIDYQCVRERNLKAAGSRLSELIKSYRDSEKNNALVLVRYMLGIFARWVMIESKRED